LVGAIILLAGGVLVFGGMLFHVLQITLRTKPPRVRAAPFPFAAAFLGLPLGALLVMGLWLPSVLRDGFIATAGVLGIAP
ncbi:MAG: hypothetical protein Q7S41_04865, partial [Candidatus Limnocylindria bacterium]|nr:hypothetical protein [Candidatus Limnocylindria bacterium]